MPSHRTPVLALALLGVAGAQQPPAPLIGGHVLPHLTISTKDAGPRTLAGIGALIPWADRLWAVGDAGLGAEDGGGLFEIDRDFALRRHQASVAGSFTNRLVHLPSRQAFLGPYAIDAEGGVRVIEALEGQRLAATAPHLAASDERVYFLTAAGLLFEVDVKSLAATQLFDLRRELQLNAGEAQFRAMHAAQGRIVVASCVYDEADYLGQRQAGRLAEWDGTAWRVVEYRPFVEVSASDLWTEPPERDGRRRGVVWALGFDRDSALLLVLHDERWQRYRLPKGSQSFDHTASAGWMRIRAAQPGRQLMDAFGLFYDVPALVHGQQAFGIRPICSHLRMVSDFCHYRGALVLAGQQSGSFVGQPQSGLWLGALDDLWSFGKPAGWGGVWHRSQVLEQQASDPFLMTGFEHKVLHLRNDGGSQARVHVEVDFLGDGTFALHTWLELGAGEYAHYVFPPGFSAHWVRLVAATPALLTAHFHYH